jgi:hypothetical protein
MTAEVGQATQRKDRDKERSYSGSCDWRRRLEEEKFAGRHRKRTNGGAFPHGGGRPWDLVHWRVAAWGIKSCELWSTSRAVCQLEAYLRVACRTLAISPFEQIGAALT